MVPVLVPVPVPASGHMLPDPTCHGVYSTIGAITANKLQQNECSRFVACVFTAAMPHHVLQKVLGEMELL